MPKSLSGALGQNFGDLGRSCVLSGTLRERLGALLGRSWGAPATLGTCSGRSSTLPGRSAEAPEPLFCKLCTQTQFFNQISSIFTSKIDCFLLAFWNDFRSIFQLIRYTLSNVFFNECLRLALDDENAPTFNFVRTASVFPCFSMNKRWRLKRKIGRGVSDNRRHHRYKNNQNIEQKSFQK